MESIIEAIDVNKSYGDNKALKNLNLLVKKGSIFSLLGPNGAGKTSFVKAVLNIIALDSGKISINGKDTKDKYSRHGVRFLPEKFSFFSYFTVFSVMSFYGRIYGIDKHDFKKEIISALEKLNISNITSQKIRTLSKGQLQRLGLAVLLLGKGELFILDEPFTGLDPIGIKELKGIILDLKKHQKTVFINSHILSEMEQICDSIAILDQGECLYQGDMDKVLKQSSLEDFFYQKVKNR